MTNLEKAVLVIGGGIGGLGAALATAEAGQKTVVFEQAPQFGEIGAGIQMGPNAMAVLDRFGLADEIAKYAVFPKRLVLKDVYTARELSFLDLGEEFKAKYGFPYMVLHRSDLHRVLFEACEKNPLISLINDQVIETVEETPAGVTVTNQRGEQFTGKAVIGADGLWSKTRKYFSDDQPICSQYVAYRGTIPISEISSDANMDDVIMWIGPNLHVVQYPVRRGELYNQVVVFKSSNYKEGSNDWGTPEEMDRVFEGCHPLVENALSFIQRQIRWPMYDREPIENWTKGNFTLLGDAAHPMLQYLAQGGCQALEDASYLADMLKVYGDNFEKAFTAYQEERIPRSAKVQKSARTWGEIIHAENPVFILLRNTLLENKEAKEFEMIDWLYGYKKIPAKI
ncbi:3-hydroxybenzoate 6-hydroxylase [Bacillus sp. AFS076308]|uniref:FAD-dependent monooxygenase n=1 Tax=unclassified Bacillus (in: firmicutes) TaxID=185979 RepID=UPI000BF88596|nr:MULTISPECIES: FAD-dependent monooxygenase [unclassified Bacillus (in: firmicutes)]PFN95926.1 3-hydroxybenzoate 6-hydroxylase [Bacillus sp. AFS076308]PGV49197.1 3-hydroxybenzoate 6-hydroxylase [Bacillus sp. AFS037270]